MSQSIASPTSSSPNSRTGATAPSSTRDHEALIAWFEDWDRQLFEAKPACREDERAAWRELTRLRHGMQGLIERFEREEAPHNERLDQLLESPG